MRIRLLFLFALPFTIHAAVDPVDLFKRHNYQEAASLWEKEVGPGPLDEKGVRSLKGLSMAYYQLGSLYSRLQPFSLALSEEYYREVLSQLDSPFSRFYLAQIQYEKENWDSAASGFQAAKVGGRFAGLNEVYRAFSAVHGQGKPNPRTFKSSLAQWQALDLSGAQPSAIPPGLKADSPRARRCRLSILARSESPMISETLEALKAVLRDGQKPEISQDSGRNTQLDFYDPLLLETLSHACLSLSQWWQMRLLEEEKRFPQLAQKFATRNSLVEACLLNGRYAEALRFLGPQSAEPEGRILRAKVLGKQGNLAAAKQLLEGVTREAGSPVVFREIAESYYFLGIDLDKGLKLASRALRDKDGANYYRISAALLLAQGQNDAALREYAKGYKIEFRNRIDQIDPEYMSDYSFAIFLTHKIRYEEIVETLYHLQKDIPACRQMHYAMQGISSGLARNFEVQRIFRKGG